MKHQRHPWLAETFGAERAAEAEAAFAVPVEHRTPRQQEIARKFLTAMIMHNVAEMRAPDARRPTTDWLRR